MEEDRITTATVVAAERLDMTPEALADILDVYLAACAEVVKKRRELHEKWR